MHDNFWEIYWDSTRPTSSFWKVALDVVTTPSGQNSLCTSYWADLWGHGPEMCLVHYWDIPRQDLTRIPWNCNPGTQQWHFPAASSWGSKPSRAASLQGQTAQRGYLYLSLLLKYPAQLCSSSLSLLCLPWIPPVELCDFIPVCSERTRTQSTVLHMSKPSIKELSFPL